MTLLNNGSGGKQLLVDNDPPLGTKANTETPDERTGTWAHFLTLMGDADMPLIDERVSDQQGVLIALFHAPLGSGDASLWALYEQFRDLFQGKKIAGANFAAVKPGSLSASPGNRWFVLRADARFEFENTPS